jgi:hypothetical protein
MQILGYTQGSTTVSSRYNENVKLKPTAVMEGTLGPPDEAISSAVSVVRRAKLMFERLFGLDHQVEHSVRRAPRGNIDVLLKAPLAKVIKVEATPRSTDSTGHIQSGKLVLEGLCRQITVKRRNLRADHPYGHLPSLRNKWFSFKF